MLYAFPSMHYLFCFIFLVRFLSGAPNYLHVSAWIILQLFISLLDAVGDGQLSRHVAERGSSLPY